MVDRALHRLASLVLARAVLAFAIIVASSLQPVLFAAGNISDHHGDSGLMLNASAEVPAPHTHAEHGQHDHADHGQAHVEDESTGTGSEAVGSGHDHSSDTNDKRCEAHCAPVQAIAVEAPFVARALFREFETDVLTALRHLELTTPSKPPRRQI